MIKPNWKTAPYWANYAAMDKDGHWAWYESKPVLSKTEPQWEYVLGSYTLKCSSFDGWENSLETRPNQEKGN